MPGAADGLPRRRLVELVQRWLLARANVWSLQHCSPPWTPPSIGAGVPNRGLRPGPVGELSGARALLWQALAALHARLLRAGRLHVWLALTAAVQAVAGGLPAAAHLHSGSAAGGA